jgi:sterol desaturase/sphingolipid hydroxylase (fatty acid hydroxylase superfamily)
MPEIAWIAPTAFATWIAVEIAAGRFRSPFSSRAETWLDVLSLAQAWFVVAPLVVLGSLLIQRQVIPQYAGAWAAVPWWAQFLAFVIADDLVQYWCHRASHAVPFLWGLHKLHHTPPYMGVRIVWRNGFFYNLFLPNVWLSGLLVYLGFGKVYLAYHLLKAVVTMGAHSEVRWDAVLYRHRALAPVAWLVERTFSTPATHFAHHAATEADGIGHYNGNYGNMLFFWDVLFGTAHITRRYPERFGLDYAGGEPKDPWYVLMFYPLFRRRTGSGAQAPGATLNANSSGRNVSSQ